MLLITFTLLHSFVVSPPPSKILKTFRDDNWNIKLIDLQTASNVLTKFSKSYQKEVIQPDFSCNPFLKTKLLQGILGLYYRDEIKVIMHFTQKRVGIAYVSSIATPYIHHHETSKILFEKIAENDSICIDQDLKLHQPNWYYSFLHYSDKI